MLNLRALHQLFYHSQVRYMVIYRLNSEKFENFDYCQNRQFRIKFAKIRVDILSNITEFTLNMPIFQNDHFKSISKMVIFMKYLKTIYIVNPRIQSVYDSCDFRPQNDNLGLEMENFSELSLKSVQLMRRKLKFRKNTGSVFQKSVCGKLKFWKKFWMRFPGFANNG